MSKKWLIVYTSLALVGCTSERPAIIKPPAEYLATVAPPVPPSDPTDENVAQFIADQDGVIRRLNGKLEALRAWFGN